MLAKIGFLDSGRGMDMSMRYALVTPARNKGREIGRTVAAIVRQSVPPERWIIVDDGSADNTAAVLRDVARRLPFVRLLSMPAGGHGFGSKARALGAGVEALKGLDHDFIGILDADVTVDRIYYETIMRRMLNEPRLGLAGGVRRYAPEGGKRCRMLPSPWGVCGAVRFFRRKCFEDIGGYLPLPRGGEGALAEAIASMKGWQVRSFPDLVVHRHTRASSGGSIPRLSFHQGPGEGVLEHAVRQTGNHGSQKAMKPVLGRCAERPWQSCNAERGLERPSPA